MSVKLVCYPILNDIHFPFEDKHRYKVALKIMRALKNVGGIYLNGDIAEFLAVSTHPKHPGDVRPFTEEVAYLNKRLDELQALFPDVPVTYLAGNHEHRFYRYIRDCAPQLWGTSDCPKLLEFERRPRWRFVDYSVHQCVRVGQSNLYLRHEPLSTGKHHAALTAERSMVDLAYGHTHQFQVGTHKKFAPGKRCETKAYSLGWLGDEKWQVFSYRGANDNWTKGFSVVFADPSTGDYTLEFIDLSKLPVLFHGRKFG